MRLRRYRPVALLLFGLHLNACATWQVTQVPLRQLVEEEQPERIRIFQADGTRIELRNPSVDTDSLTAVASVRLSPARFRTDTVSIPLTDVRAFEVRRFSIARTVGVIVVAPLAALGILVLCAGGVICEGL